MDPTLGAFAPKKDDGTVSRPLADQKDGRGRRSVCLLFPSSSREVERPTSCNGDVRRKTHTASTTMAIP